MTAMYISYLYILNHASVVINVKVKHLNPIYSF